MQLRAHTLMEVENLSKLYARSSAVSRRRAGSVLGRVLLGMAVPGIVSIAQSEFWALRNIGFRLCQGEALGIIGLNGLARRRC